MKKIFIIVISSLAFSLIINAQTVNYQFTNWDVNSNWDSSPDNLVDLSTTTFGQDNEDGDYLNLNDNNCPGTDLGTITNVEISVYFKNNYSSANKSVVPRLIPYFNGSNAGDTHNDAVGDYSTAAWSTWFEITSDANAPGTWTWSDVQNLDCRVETYRPNNGNLSVAKIRIRVTYSVAPPINDECADAITLTVNPDGLCGTTTSGTIEGATQSADAEGCGGISNDDVWYEFTATATSHYISLLNISGSETDMYYSLYDGCNGFEALCNDDNISTISGLVIGTTYLMRVYTYYSGTDNTTFDICIGTPPPPPANDECASAVSISVSADNTCANGISSSLTSATDSGIAGCAGTADDDVWFTFVATDTQQGIEISNASGSVTDLVHEVFTGNNCASASSVVCSNTDISEETGYVIGDTYWVRVYSWTSTTGQNVTFDICVYEVVPTCSDGVQNQDETGVDCGGVCPECVPMGTAQDCVDGITVCGDETIAGNSNGFNNQELVSGNQGCLSGEHESNWVFFHAETDGLLYFTISPNNGSDDYDFAIWEYDGSCPPSTDPIRCSFAVDSPPTTGLNIGAGDDSEDSFGDNWVNAINANAGDEFIMLIDNYSTTTSPYTLVWDMSLSDATLDCAVLPVQLVNSSYNCSKNILSWQTQSENNNDYYTIQTGTNFDKTELIVEQEYRVAGNGTTNSIIDYSFNLKANKEYIRVLQTDFDGTESIIFQTYASCSKEDNITLSPNPTKGSSYINGKYDSIEIYDITGKKVNATVIDNQISGLMPGVYIVIVDLKERIKLLVKK